jgi:hypothetical protein
MQDLPTIGGTIYPYSVSEINERNYQIDFKGLSGKSFNLSVKGIFPGELFEICSLQSNNQTLVSKKQYENDKQEIIIRCGTEMTVMPFNGSIQGVFHMANGNYLISIIESDLHHIMVCNPKGKVINKSIVGQTSWHSQSSIAQSDNGIIMFATYPINGVNDNPKLQSRIYRSTDNGINWDICFSVDYPEIRHWHTLILLDGNKWLATSGDTASQSRWFQSIDDGESWPEVTDLNFHKKFPRDKKRYDKIHRTTSMFEKEEIIFAATDDIMGNPLHYFQFLPGNIRKTASIFYSACLTLDKSYEITKLSQLGLHIRSIIQMKDGVLLISEGQNPTYDFQVFFAEWGYLTKPLFLGSFLSGRTNGGTHSKHSLPDENGTFFTRVRYRSFFDCPVSMLEWNFSQTNTEINTNFLIEDTHQFQSHLWEFDNMEGIRKVLFSNGELRITFNKSSHTSIYLCGKNINKETYQLLSTRNASEYSMDLFCTGDEGFSIIAHIDQYDDNHELLSTNPHELVNGNNNLSGEINSQYLRLRIDMDHSGGFNDYSFKDVLLSNLKLSLK